MGKKHEDFGIDARPHFDPKGPLSAEQVTAPHALDVASGVGERAVAGDGEPLPRHLDPDLSWRGPYDDLNGRIIQDWLDQRHREEGW